MCRFVFLACFFVDGQKIAWFINHPGCILKRLKSDLFATLSPYVRCRRRNVPHVKVGVQS